MWMAMPTRRTSMGNDPVDGRSGQILNILIEDHPVKAGEEYAIAFRAAEFEQLMAYQWILDFDMNRLEYLDADFGVLNNFGANNIGLYGLEQGLISMIWYDVRGANLASDDALFTLHFRALEDADNLSEMIGIGEYDLATAAFTESGMAADIQLQFNTTHTPTTVADAFVLYQNTPNPFRNETLISFNLPKASNARLSIMDVSGRVVRVIEATYPAGYNEVSLNSSDLPATGVLYYQLDTAENTAVRKMVILD